MPKLVSLADMMKQASGDDDTPASIEKWAEEQLAQAKKRVEMFEKALVDIRKYGGAGWDRLYKYTQGVDPDAPIEKVGPHGAGCECPTEEDMLCGKTDDTVN